MRVPHGMSKSGSTAKRLDVTAWTHPSRFDRCCEE